jgi:O-antigen ligase/Flp pilus assembly protein TadD
MMCGVVPQTLQWQRIAVAVAVVGGALVMWPTDGDVFGVPKATLVVLCGLVAVAIGVGREIRTRTVVVPWTPPVLAAAVFIVAYGVATLTSTTPMQSLVGQYQQNAGLAMYAAAVALFLTTVRSHDERTLPSLVRALVVATALIVVYAVMQWVGIEPFDFTASDIFSTLGNSNFLAGWVGIAIPLCLGLAVARSATLPWRVVGAVTALVIVPVSVATDSFQGPMTVAVSVLAFVGLLVASGGLAVPAPLRGRRGLAVLVLVVVVAAPVAVKVVGDGIDQGLLERRYFWRAAVQVVKDHPVLGTGPDTFHNQYLSRRSPAHAANVTGKNAGAAHDVPLEILVDGGLVAGLPYFAFVGLVGWSLVVAVRRRRWDPWLVSGIGAAWIGYQVQSLVSLDKPALITVHWVLAGAIVVLAGPVEARVLSVPGRGRQGATASLSTVVSIGALGLVTVVAAWFVTQPFRADLAVIAGKQAMEAGNGAGAEHHFAEARRLAPWEASYTYAQVVLGSRLGNADYTLQAAEDGARLEPGDSSYALVAAQIADVVKRPAVARKWYDQALVEDPYGLDVLTAAAKSAARAGDATRTHAFIRRALAVSRKAVTVWTAIGDARALLHEDVAAGQAYREALALSPGYPAAKKGLEQLGK